MHTVTPEQLATRLSALPARPRVVASGNFATPLTALAVLDQAVPEYTLFVLNAQTAMPDRDGVVLETCFVGPGMRGSPRLRYVPSRLSLTPVLFESALAPDVVLLHTTPPAGGTVSLGVEVDILPAAVEAVRRRGGLVVAQANRHMPYTPGDGVLDVEDIDLLIEVDGPLPSPGPRVHDETAHAIGTSVAGLVSDGATLQTGIGAVPDAVLASLVARRHLRMWTETFSDGVLALERAGAFDRDHPLHTSFVFGSPELYEWLDGNERVLMIRTQRINNPRRIAANRLMTSINAALQVDLYDQANASRVRGRPYSGLGGQPDFVVGALHAPGGQAIIALPSWHARAEVSTIVPLLDAPATSFQHSSVVTDQGVARMFGRSQREQATELIENAAHPEAREGLREYAVGAGLI